ncbi:unnamed protein product [Medioppia subpectinata]|uniref:Uncharacterized protein n=1 Tax=Medioppia subpectinata TaxID=1979941 RepID=A0A7R9KZ13_9ACAR|nr:unnamed protein product [Medioppia subpectinata]CAG2111299.1 unnamed protein product [Medioppia subpectinata]
MAFVGNITHVIFDLDGTLIDTELWGLTNVNKILATYGHSLSQQTYGQYIGFTPFDRCKRIIDDLALDYDNQKFLNDWINECLKTVTTIQLMPGVRRLVEHLYSHGIPLAIGTAGKRAEYYPKTAHLEDLFVEGKYFSHVVHGDDKRVKRSKPFPDLFQVCASLFTPSPEPIISRTRQVLADFAMSCDDNGRLILKPRQTVKNTIEHLKI